MKPTHKKQSSLADSWHPENWDLVSVMWLKTPDGQESLNLLKAAPDLLAACEAVSTFLDGWCPTQCSCANGAETIHNQLLAAIKKARVGTP